MTNRRTGSGRVRLHRSPPSLQPTPPKPGSGRTCRPSHRLLAILKHALRIGCVCLFLLASRGHALRIEPLSLDRLADQAALVVRGTVLSKSCQRDPAGRIYTKVQLDVVEVWKGSPA